MTIWLGPDLVSSMAAAMTWAVAAEKSTGVRIVFMVATVCSKSAENATHRLVASAQILLRRAGQKMRLLPRTACGLFSLPFVGL